MFSVTYTGMNFLPLCTAIVCPTISGTIVERRDQVRSTFFSLRAFMAATFVARCASTNGPFLVDRAIISFVETRLASSQRRGKPRLYKTVIPSFGGSALNHTLPFCFPGFIHAATGPPARPHDLQLI